MVKKMSVLFILIFAICLIQSQTLDPRNFWVDLGWGYNDLQKNNDAQSSVRLGLTNQIRGNWHLSLHLSSGSLDFESSGESSSQVSGWGTLAFDVQCLRVLPFGIFELVPAIGVGYAGVGKKNSTGNFEDEHKNYAAGTITLPCSCDLRYNLSKAVALQLTGITSFNPERTFQGIYASLVLGRLK